MPEYFCMIGKPEERVWHLFLAGELPEVTPGSSSSHALAAKGWLRPPSFLWNPLPDKEGVRRTGEADVLPLCAGRQPQPILMATSAHPTCILCQACALTHLTPPTKLWGR